MMGENKENLANDLSILGLVVLERKPIFLYTGVFIYEMIKISNR